MFFVALASAACSSSPADKDLGVADLAVADSSLPSGTKLSEGPCSAQLQNARCYYLDSPDSFY